MEAEKKVREEGRRSTRGQIEAVVVDGRLEANERGKGGPSRGRVQVVAGTIESPESADVDKDSFLLET